MYILQNEHLLIEIAPQGAELRSLVSKQDGRNYIWQRDASYWPKSSPILFPIVGELKHGSYVYDGQSYSLPKHGFARDRTFALLEERPNEVAFVLTADNESKAMYPFDFQLILRYVLQERSLLCSYELQNKGDKTMYFSLGGHPAFQLDLSKGKHMSDYYLVFPNDHALTRYFIKNGLLDTQAEWQPLEGIRLPLYTQMFEKDAWVLKDLRSSNVLLQNRQGDYRLDIHFPGFPYFGLWAPVGAPFICLEPWCGVNDVSQHHGELSQKEGIVALDSSDRWKRSWCVKVGM
ncbi:aldose 1-epimerase family protein [Sphingobacterium griseoflavum]|uniref:Aldose 1-epimerase n=1 Tax=Sphingobacterium griseoflavum TaxID=1474952 RepID=A0ABQ3HYU4_9SPHI|nr:aldose 1-epimerase family protein [Sphingobacterium griseoflavum]GHE39360.1 aldose 1-epimerase [Sphingobacterium griseoflavum]